MRLLAIPEHSGRYAIVVGPFWCRRQAVEDAGMNGSLFLNQHARAADETSDSQTGFGSAKLFTHPAN